MKLLITILSMLFCVYIHAQPIPDQVLYTDENGYTLIPDYISQFNISDNCELDYSIQSPSIGFIIQPGVPAINMMVKSYDLSSNSSTVDFDILVIDTFNTDIIDSVIIGNQIWMSDNLKVAYYNDGIPIPQVQENNFHLLDTGAYTWYNNDSATYEHTYGKLYNYYAINSGKLCPSGWRVPTEQDYKELITYLDPNVNFVRYASSTIAGGMLKDTLIWLPPNLGASNSSGFGALPGGCRSYISNFSMGGTFGYYGFTPNQGSIALRWVTPTLFMRDGISKYVAVSVKCIKE